MAVLTALLQGLWQKVALSSTQWSEFCHLVMSLPQKWRLHGSSLLDINPSAA